MVNKKENKKTNQWDFNEMQESLIKDHEKKITQGFEDIKSGQKNQMKTQEPTKGVQTYIPMSMYRRLNDLKLTRGETIGNLVIQAIALWLDQQDGKKVNATT